MSDCIYLSDLLCSAWRRKNEVVEPRADRRKKMKHKSFAEAETDAAEMADTRGRCVFCGRRVVGIPLDKVVSDNFTEWDRCFDGSVSCVACASARWWEDSRYRGGHYRYFISPDYIVEPSFGNGDSVAELRDALLSPNKAMPYIFGVAPANTYGAVLSPLNYSTEELLGHYYTGSFVRISARDMAILIGIKAMVNKTFNTAPKKSPEMGAAVRIKKILAAPPSPSGFPEKKVQGIGEDLDKLRGFSSQPLSLEEFLTALPAARAGGWLLADGMFAVSKEKPPDDNGNSAKGKKRKTKADKKSKKEGVN